MRVLATLTIALVAPAFHTSTKPLPPKVYSEVKARNWHDGCPTPLSDLRLLTVSYWGFDSRMHHGQLVVNKAAAGPLAQAFQQLYKLRFPIRHMLLANMYGPPGSRPKDGDVTGSFSCRAAVPSSATTRTALPTFSAPSSSPYKRVTLCLLWRVYVR